MIRQWVDNSFAQGYRLLKAGKNLFYPLFHFSYIKITNRHNSHQVGAVPVVVKFFKSFRFTTLDNLNLTYWTPLRITGVFIQIGNLYVRHPGISAPAQPPLLNYYPPFAFYLLIIKADIRSPVPQYQQGIGQDLFPVSGHLEPVYRFIKTGIGIEVGTKTHTY
ncbi:hypothetical protein ES708_22807 [subsurface metagenome]